MKNPPLARLLKPGIPPKAWVPAGSWGTRTGLRRARREYSDLWLPSCFRDRDFVVGNFLRGLSDRVRCLIHATSLLRVVFAHSTGRCFLCAIQFFVLFTHRFLLDSSILPGTWDTSIRRQQQPCRQAISVQLCANLVDRTNASSLEGAARAVVLKDTGHRREREYPSQWNPGGARRQLR